MYIKTTCKITKVIPSVSRRRHLALVAYIIASTDLYIMSVLGLLHLMIYFVSCRLLLRRTGRFEAKTWSSALSLLSVQGTLSVASRTAAYIIKSNCTNENCTHPSHNQIIKAPGTTLPSGACHSAHIAPTPPHCSPKVLDGVRSGHPSRSGRGLHSWAESTGRVASYPACSAGIQQTPAFSADNQASPIQEAAATVSRTISALDLRTFTYRQSPGQAAFETERFSKYNVVPEVPTYTQELYEKDLVDPSWTKDETDYLMETYRECSGKWPVIIDRYESERPRTMEDLKARFYFISSRILSHQTPISSMTGPEYDLYETLKSFDPHKEGSRKNESCYTSQPSMRNERIYVVVYIIHKQTATDTNKARRVQRLRSTDTQPRPNQPQASAPPPPAPAENETSTDLSKADLTRFGVVQANEKLPSGISFASDRLSKPRVAKANSSAHRAGH
ncbi:hypothetical protein KC326_g95 [Hortaea werneckii]|nr:hypothetical protein KC326_g95 [Hortaea werneckii]